MIEDEVKLEGIFCSINDKEKEKLKKIRNEFLDSFNSTLKEDTLKREELIKKYFGSCGKNPSIDKPFYCDYGANIFVGDNFFANHDCNILDVSKINIGSNVCLGPNVSIYTAGYFEEKDNSNYEYGVNIGSDVWIGGSTVINPGVNIGSNVVIGSCSVVVSDIPSNCIAGGNPCKVLRELNENDTKYWLEQMMANEKCK